MESITAFIIGETEWQRIPFKTESLNKLKDPTFDMGLASEMMGRILDRGPLDITAEEKHELYTLLSGYVANTNTYQRMLREDIQSIFITSFKTVSLNYFTRVAGILAPDIEEAKSSLPVVTPGYAILLACMQKNEHYKKDKYHKTSLYHDTMRQAKSFNITII